MILITIACDIIIISSILRRNKLRLGASKKFLKHQDHRANKEQRWDLNSGFPESQVSVPTTKLN